MLDSRLVVVIARVLDIPGEQITPDLSADRIADWDSVNHFKLILSIEEEYGVRFPMAEIPRLRSIDRIQEALSRMTK